MKKLLSVLLASCIVMAVGCGDKTDSGDGTTTTPTSTEANDETSIDETEAEEEEETTEAEAEIAVLYSNDFETDEGGFVGRGPDEAHEDWGKYDLVAELTNEDAHSGAQSFKVTGRGRGWNGVIFDATEYFKATKKYRFKASVWVKIDPASEKGCTLQLSQQTDIEGQNVEYIWLDDLDDGSGYASAEVSPGDDWVQLVGSGMWSSSNDGIVQLYIETREGLASFYVDDFEIYVE